MKRLLLLLLIGGCKTLESLDVSAMTGGRVQSLDFAKVGKGVSALRKGVEDISESEEYYIGRAVSAQILARYKPWNDPKANLYAQKVLQAVAMASDRPSTYKGWHVQLLDSDEINAFAAPGGFIFVTKGMVRLADDEDELAAVLAHEVAHVTRRHGLKAIQSSRLTSAFALLGSEVARNNEHLQQLTSVFEGAVDDVVKKLVVNGYSRDKEHEADREAVGYARGAGYDAAGLPSFLKRLGAADKGGGLFKTHPKAEKRVSALGPLAPGKRSAARKNRFKAALGA